MEKIIIYTDGSSKGNPGPGGWSAIVVNDGKSEIKEIGGRKEMTTNNKMEIMAAIEALKNTPPNSKVLIHSDSEYLIKGITIWIKNWQKNNWRTKDKKEVLNRDLWEKLWDEVEKREVEWQKVLGHSGHAWNDRCDKIAQSSAEGKKIILYNGSKQEYKGFHNV